MTDRCRDQKRRVSNHSILLRRITLASHVLAFAGLLGASSIASTSALVLERAPPSFSLHPLELTLSKRHGDDEHEEVHHGMPVSQMPTPAKPTQDEHHHDTNHLQSNNTSQTNKEEHHHHNHMDDMTVFIPDPLAQTKDTFLSVPKLPKGAGGHSHGGHAEPKLELNESVILRGKGPDPLSYIEWDFSYGIGKLPDLVRFSKAYSQLNDESSNIMGVGGGRWRTLVDEKEGAVRSSIASDIKHRVDSGSDDDVGRHRLLLISHVVGCIISCFILLPIALALRAADSDLAPWASFLYLLSLLGSLCLSKVYKRWTPQLYPSNSHGGLGYAIFWISLFALRNDVFKLLVRVLSMVKGARASSKAMSYRSFVKSFSFGATKNNSKVEEYDPLEEEKMLHAEDGESDAQEGDYHQFERNFQRTLGSVSSSHSSSHRVHFANESGQNIEAAPQDTWIGPQYVSRDTSSPTSTLCNTPRSLSFSSLHHPVPKEGWEMPSVLQESADERISSWRQYDDLQDRHSQQQHPRAGHAVEKKYGPRSGKQVLKSIVRYSDVTIARSIPVLSFAAAYTGLAIYTGSCRGPYKNVCIAHGVKGGIFFWYGLLSFARYLGAYADLGWAWNRKPTSGSKKDSGSNGISAEWVECFVIFFYGSTNMWMERFGAAPGDAYTVKQVQHISIAVMFCFAGLMGLILETKSIKKLLAISVVLRQTTVNEEDATVGGVEALALPALPPSYNFSFNPFPALVIGVTGVAMAAHHQDYLYEVSIHQLWGNLLAAFSVFRILTYFFLFLRPPTNSILPSRPPTEALASFCLTSGGLVFMLSSEEVSFVAMRNGFGDFMMIMNLTVAIVSFVFCLIAALMIFKAYAVQREQRRTERPNSLVREEGEEEEEAEHEPQSSSGKQGAASRLLPSVFVLEDEEEEEKDGHLRLSTNNSEQI
ncbi:hypothetical protein CBS101457_004393 [Exobasidium rhododendri]|nr:hypothetical protein CBS101457_004393 [Exobasidium rhododendri]